MAGLVPAIHVFITRRCRKHMDARDKRGHDDSKADARPRPTRKLRSPPMTASHRSSDLGQTLREAVTMQQQGRLREAEKIYKRVLKAAPDQFDALNLLGTIKVQRGQAGEAYRLISAALQVNPRAADAWVNLGIVLHALKRDQEALESFDKALALKPGDADALYERGNTLLALGRSEEHTSELQSLR